jgi:hypothetical protein
MKSVQKSVKTIVLVSSLALLSSLSAYSSGEGFPTEAEAELVENQKNPIMDLIENAKKYTGLYESVQEESNLRISIGFWDSMSEIISVIFPSQKRYVVRIVKENLSEKGKFSLEHLVCSFSGEEIEIRPATQSEKIVINGLECENMSSGAESTLVVTKSNDEKTSFYLVNRVMQRQIGSTGYKQVQAQYPQN